MEKVRKSKNIRTSVPTTIRDCRGSLSVLFDGGSDPPVALKESFSKSGVFRGLHHQRHPHPQEKIVYIKEGEILDLMLNLDLSSENYGNLYIKKLSAERKEVLFIPSCYAHGFYALRDVIFSYVTFGKYSPSHEITIYPPAKFFTMFNIDEASLIVSDKDLESKAKPFLYNQIHMI